MRKHEAGAPAVMHVYVESWRGAARADSDL